MSHGVILSDKNKALLEKGRAALTCCCNAGIFSLPLEHPVMYFPYRSTGDSTAVQFADQSTNLTWIAPEMSYGLGFTGPVDSALSAYNLSKAAVSIYEPCAGKWLMYPYNLCRSIGNTAMQSAYWNYPAMASDYPYDCTLAIERTSNAYAGVTYHYGDSTLLDFQDAGNPHFFLKLPPVQQIFRMYDSDLKQYVDVKCTYKFTDIPDFTDSLKSKHAYSWQLLSASADYYLPGEASAHTKTYKVRSDCHGTIKWTFQSMDREVPYYDSEGHLSYTRYCYPLAKSFSGGVQDLTVDITADGDEIFHEFVNDAIIIPATTDLTCLDLPSFSLMGVCSFSDAECKGCLYDTYAIEVLDDMADSLDGLCVGTGLRGSYSLTLLASAYQHYEIIDDAITFVTDTGVDKDALLDTLKNNCAGTSSWSITGQCRCCNTSTCDDCISLGSIGTACSADIDTESCGGGIKTVILHNGFATQKDAQDYIDNHSSDLLEILKNTCSFSFSTAVTLEGDDTTAKNYVLPYSGTYKMIYTAGALRNGAAQNWNCGDHIPQYSIDGANSWINFPGAWGIGTGCFSDGTTAESESIGSYISIAVDIRSNNILLARSNSAGSASAGSITWTLELVSCQI